MREHVTRLLIFTACATAIAMIPAAAGSLPTCNDGATLAYYETTYGSTGCQVGNLIFSNFNYEGASATGGGTAPATAAGIVVDTLGPAGSGASGASTQFPTSIGLSFTGSWNAPVDGSTADGDIIFDVTVAGGGAATLEDAGLAQTSGPVTGTGVAAVGEDGCSGIVAPCTQQWGIATLQSGSYVDAVSGPVTYTPTGSISVSKDVTVGAGSNGVAFLSNIQDTFSQVPEPRAISLFLGLGLLAGLMLRKKFQSAQN